MELTWFYLQDHIPDYLFIYLFKELLEKWSG